MHCSLVKTVRFLCGLPGPSVKASCFVGEYLKDATNKDFMGFRAQGETVLKFLPVPVPYFQVSDENLFYLHAALYTHNKNCSGIIRINSCSKGKCKEPQKLLVVEQLIYLLSKYRTHQSCFPGQRRMVSLKTACVTKYLWKRLFSKASDFLSKFLSLLFSFFSKRHDFLQV